MITELRRVRVPAFETELPGATMKASAPRIMTKYFAGIGNRK